MGKNRAICTCKHVTKADIKKAVAQGATTYKEVEALTGAGSKCGKCRKEVKKAIRKAARHLEEKQEQPERAAKEARSLSMDASIAKPKPTGSRTPLLRFPQELTSRAIPITGAAQDEICVHGIYRHFKGDYYLVEGVATGSEDGITYVIYRKLYGDTSLVAKSSTANRLGRLLQRRRPIFVPIGKGCSAQRLSHDSI